MQASLRRRIRRELPLCNELFCYGYIIDPNTGVPSEPVVGSPRIHGELLKLGIEVAQSPVAKYLRRPRRPPSQTLRTFLINHKDQTASIDFFLVPTVTFRVLFVFDV